MRYARYKAAARKPDRFSRFATLVAHWAGKPVVFGCALAAMILWALVGPFFGFSDVWQLSVNTGTTIITFLMVFVIQNTQNRDSAAIQIKIDELIRVSKEAHNSLLDLEELSEEELEEFRAHYEMLAREARARSMRRAHRADENAGHERSTKNAPTRGPKSERG
ncbi:low affinity iron permease family protein [Chelatococcus sp. SYSU_G07232]|uniref:Low affinity iron permease family protein n=1 Tax=Chelatococcus albus TaxID=3047466 RepID=A0ABT7AFI6_9HYPH|nr:low affinity iron permease family protein [Chelatococcus sp. SYSU_G07232]MDJ1158147.1 low affinity iron permease family protein [Chelatococcus sp. SYSU_G07232]